MPFHFPGLPFVLLAICLVACKSPDVSSDEEQGQEQLSPCAEEWTGWWALSADVLGDDYGAVPLNPWLFEVVDATELRITVHNDEPGYTGSFGLPEEIEVPGTGTVLFADWAMDQPPVGDLLCPEDEDVNIGANSMFQLRGPEGGRMDLTMITPNRFEGWLQPQGEMVAWFIRANRVGSPLGGTGSLTMGSAHGGMTTLSIKARHKDSVMVIQGSGLVIRGYLEGSIFEGAGLWSRLRGAAWSHDAVNLHLRIEATAEGQAWTGSWLSANDGGPIEGWLAAESVPR